MSGWIPPALMGLPPEQAEAIPLLAEFERDHPGVTVVQPHYSHEPWCVDIDAGAVPGDERTMTGHGNGPAEMLAWLKALFGTR